MAEIDPDFKSLAETLKNSRHDIVAELKACQGTAVDVGGYYKVDPVKAEKAMRPSETLNKIIDG